MRLLTYNIHKGIGGRDRPIPARPDRPACSTRRTPTSSASRRWTATSAGRGSTTSPRCWPRPWARSRALDQLVFPRGEGGYGNLILSQWPFAEADQFSIRKGRRKPRGAQIGRRRDARRADPALAHAHLGLNERERHWQVERCCRIRSSRGRHAADVLSRGTATTGATPWSAGPFARHGFRQVTWPPSRFRSFPAYLPMASLDKVFVRGPVAVESARVVKTAMSRRASDHLPVIVDFSIGRKAPGISDR